MKIHPQPDDSTCGPTCLHAIYNHFGERLELAQVIQAIPQLDAGGTLAVMLGIDALQRGYDATIYTYNLQVFDPTWFPSESPLEWEMEVTPEPPERTEHLVAKLRAQMRAKRSRKLRLASRAYIEFLQRGGKIRMRDLDADLVCGFLGQSIPLLAGLSSTYLYRAFREFGPNLVDDDIRGHASGHFVVLFDYDRGQQTVGIADPYLPNPLGKEHHYHVPFNRLICAIMLGVLTYDANLLAIRPQQSPAPESLSSAATPVRSQAQLTTAPKTSRRSNPR